MSRLLIVAAVAAIALSMMYAPKDAIVLDAEQYCQYVHDRAWPDFHKVYAKQCRPDGSVNWDYVNGRRSK